MQLTATAPSYAQQIWSLIYVFDRASSM